MDALKLVEGTCPECGIGWGRKHMELVEWTVPNGGAVIDMDRSYGRLTSLAWSSRPHTR